MTTKQGALERPGAVDVRDGALFLDLDGTLAPIAPRPQDVRPSESRSTLLRALADRLDGRLAVVSGRTIAEVDRILEGSVATVAGVHGLERRWPDGRVDRSAPDPNMDSARASLADLSRRYPGLLIEDKGLALAVHYRGRPEAGQAVQDAARLLSATTGLVTQLGDMVVELRGLGPRKGDAVMAFMREPPFLGSRPVFVGDDLTDEDGFAAAQSAGGEGVLVGPMRSTAAQRRLEDVAAVFDWLNAVAAGDVPA